MLSTVVEMLDSRITCLQSSLTCGSWMVVVRLIMLLCLLANLGALHLQIMVLFFIFNVYVFLCYGMNYLCN